MTQREEELISRLLSRAEFEDNGGTCDRSLEDVGALLREAASAIVATPKPEATEGGAHEADKLREENRRLLAIEKAAQRLAYVVRKSVNAGPVSNDPTAEGQAWRALRLALGESYDEKGALT